MRTRLLFCKYSSFLKVSLSISLSLYPSIYHGGWNKYRDCIVLRCTISNIDWRFGSWNLTSQPFFLWKPSVLWVGCRLTFAVFPDCVIMMMFLCLCKEWQSVYLQDKLLKISPYRICIFLVHTHSFPTLGTQQHAELHRCITSPPPPKFAWRCPRQVMCCY